jgi:predicted RNA-binding protein YlxR (DUF448 family)
VQPRERLVRFVVDPGGAVVPDIAGRLPGRGFWLSADRDMIDRACARKVFAKFARADVVVPGALADDVERLLVRRCQDLIGLARRAKRAVCGYARTRQWLERNEAAVLLAARDGSRDQRDKMRPSGGSVPVIGVLSAAELGHAYGRERVVHGAIGAGALAVKLLDEARRLDGLRGSDATPEAVGTQERACSGQVQT